MRSSSRWQGSHKVGKCYQKLMQWCGILVKGPKTVCHRCVLTSTGPPAGIAMASSFLWKTSSMRTCTVDVEL